METLKLLPQLFYDLISRVIPGVIALVLIAHVSEHDLGSLISGPFAGAPSLQGSPLFLGIATVGAAYIVGQVLAPLSDLYERRLIGTVVPPGYWVFPAAVQPQSPYPTAMRAFLRQELDVADDGRPGGDGGYSVALFVWYDWLRVWKPEAGMRVTKLRAEYRMFGGIAVAAIFAAVLHALLGLLARVRFEPGLVLLCLLFSGFASWGMIRTYRTFQRSVLNQYYVSKSARPAHEPEVPAERLAPLG